MIDLLSIEPHQVSRTMQGYSLLLYGEAKVGKTTTACKFEKHLLLATEKGYSAIPGAMAQPIDSWADLKRAIKQLKDEKVKERFKYIILDTADIAYDLCEKYLCSNYGVNSIGEIPYGAGYGLVAKEFDETIRRIVQLDYGLIMISHSQEKTFTNEKGQEYQKIVPTLGNKARNVVCRLCDIIGYIQSEDKPEGGVKSFLYMRGTPRFMAGSRFKYIPPKIELSYDNLVKAVNEAIDKESSEVGNEYFTDEKQNLYNKFEELDFDELKANFDAIVKKLMTSNSEKDFSEQIAPQINEIVEKYLGKGKKVANCTRGQSEALSLIVDDLTALYG